MKNYFVIVLGCLSCFTVTVTDSFAQINCDSVKIRPMDEINTLQNELAPSWEIFPDERIGDFYFIRGASWYLDTIGHGIFHTAITSKSDGDFWTLSNRESPLYLESHPASAFECGPVWVTQGGEYLYAGVASLDAYADPTNKNKADIVAYSRSNGRLEFAPDNYLTKLVNSTAAWDSHPTLENDVLFFASDREGGKGGMDIWYVVINGKEFKGPFNATDINTEYDENFPSLPPDDARTLYFSSNRPRKDGKDYGFDIYVAKRITSKDEGSEKKTPFKFSEPELMPCINTPDNEVSFVAMDEKRAFYASDAPRSKWSNVRNFDIYQVTPNPDPDLRSLGVPPTVPPVKVACTGKQVNFAMNFDIYDVTNNQNKKIGDFTLLGDGKAINVVIPNSVTVDNYSRVLQIWPHAPDAYLVMPSLLRYNGKGWDIDPLILFERDSIAPCPLAYKSIVEYTKASPILSSDDSSRLRKEIDNFLPFLRSVPPAMTINFSFEGHTEALATTYKVQDSRSGDWSKNQLLSEDRARMAMEFYRDYLGSRGNLKASVNYGFRGFGYSALKVPFVSRRNPPLPRDIDATKIFRDPGDHDEEYYNSQNRRVEIKVSITRGS